MNLEQEKINKIISDENKKRKASDNIKNNQKIEDSTNLNSTKIRDNNTTKIDNITTAINKKDINSPRKRKNRRNIRI